MSHPLLCKLTDLTLLTLKENQDYHVSIAALYSVFYAIWSNKKLNYMSYCKKRAEFWPMIANTLHIIKKEMDPNGGKKNANVSLAANNFEAGQSFNDETTAEYLEYFDTDNIVYENEFSRFNEFILEANIKSVSYSLKIYSIQIFEMCFLE